MKMPLISIENVNKLRRGYAHTLRKVPGANHSIEHVNLVFPFTYLLHYLAIISFIFGNYIQFNKESRGQANSFIVFGIVLFIIAIYYVFAKYYLFKGVSDEEVDANSETRKQDMKFYIKTMLWGFGSFICIGIYFSILSKFYE
ncbi:hypothetical protein BWI93_14825 [Siphonobacter sp. BAB-5385]|uniref:hypothetical protein n=1 Tax=Siphonobacter sp. BAB-5385 TaxID=1864822 RepID=UPI000B9EE01F|nr:hypothetical protein [Siphonobacter sp. BAB-5385]OZI07307.1 hypothetical protein BWI93_14825 [Siphonobacter sp. BAB-5385]